MAKKQTSEAAVEVQEVKLHSINITLNGTSPLIVHNFSVKAQAQMLAKQCKVTWPKEAKNPALQFEGATYYIDKDGNPITCPADLTLIAEGKVKNFIEQYAEHLKTLQAAKPKIFGFPSVGFKAAAIRGAKSLGLVMADMKGAFYIPREFVEIKGERRMRSDMVRISHSTSDVRFRAEFPEWSTTFEVVYNAAVVTPDLLFNMFQTAGFSCGVGEWRPEKGGNKGMFTVAATK